MAEPHVTIAVSDAASGEAATGDALDFVAELSDEPSDAATTTDAASATVTLSDSVL